MKINRNIVSALPFIPLIASGASNFIEFSTSGYFLIGDIMGYSLVTDLFMLFMVFNLRFCIYTKIAVIGLCMLTLVSILNPILNYVEYAKIYDNVIVGLCLLFCAIIFIKKWLRT